MFKINCALLFIALSFTACQSTDSQKTSSLDSTLVQETTVVNESVKSRFDSTLKSMVESGQIAGVSALIFEKDKEVYFNAFGFAEWEAKRKMDRNTLVRIFSMTKPITGTALMQLYEQGAFQLDDPLEKYPLNLLT